MSSLERISRWWRWWFAGYIVLVGAIVGTMLWWRHSTIPELSTEKSISDWQEWKEARVQAEKSQTGPVHLRAPKSDEPPELVLMRDYFGVLIIGALVFTSLLYWILVWFLNGIYNTKPTHLPSILNTPH